MLSSYLEVVLDPHGNDGEGEGEGVGHDPISARSRRPTTLEVAMPSKLIGADIVDANQDRIVFGL